MFRLCCNITIGGVSFNQVHSVEIDRSIDTLGATATIKVPVTAVLRSEDSSKQTETAKQVNVGDKVVIELGYNDSLQREFVGYVRRVNLRSPLEIECEDEIYTARNNSVLLKGKMTLSDIISQCGLQGGNVDALTLTDFEADNKSVAWVLGKIKSKYGLAIYYDLDGKVHAHSPTEVTSSSVAYKLRYNVITDNDLTYQRAEDVKFCVIAKCTTADGTDVQVKAGVEGGESKTIEFYNVESLQELSEIAQRELKRYSYDGYRGQITTFLEPFAEPTMVAKIEDDIYPGRNGSYLIEGVKTTFGQQGARRVIDIGIKI